MNENKRVLINGLTKQETEATASCAGLSNGESKQAEPVGVEKFTALMVGENHGLIGPFGSDFKGSPEHYRRITVYTQPAQPVQSAGAQGEAVGEVVEEKMAPWCPPHASVKWFQMDFEIGTKFYTEAPAAEPAPLVRLTDEDIKVLQAFHNFNVCTTSDKDLVTFAHAIQDAMQEKNK